MAEPLAKVSAIDERLDIAQHSIRRQRRIDAMPIDRSKVLSPLRANNRLVGVGRIETASVRTFDQHLLRRVQPYPDERHQGRSGYTLNRMPVGRSRVNGIDNRTMPAPHDETCSVGNVA